MAVNSTHPDYGSSLADWSRMRDVMAGEDAVKGVGEKYLPSMDRATKGKREVGGGRQTNEPEKQFSFTRVALNQPVRLRSALPAAAGLPELQFSGLIVPTATLCYYGI